VPTSDTRGALLKVSDAEQKRAVFPAYLRVSVGEGERYALQSYAAKRMNAEFVAVIGDKCCAMNNQRFSRYIVVPPIYSPATARLQ